jgi:hypothetical protein
MSIPAELDTIESALKRIRELLGSQQGTPIPSGDDRALQAALDGGGRVILEAGGSYRGSFRISRPGTILQGNGATLHGVDGPALDVLPGVTDVHLLDLPSVTSDVDAAIRLGRNTSAQTTLELVPRRITFERVVVPEHHGPHSKNGLENNGAEVTLLDCEIVNVFSPTGVESHAIASLNTVGGLTVRGGTYSAGSICLFSGGDALKLSGVDIEHLTYENLRITKPVEWQTDGVPRNVKNLIELKNGSHVLVKNCEIFNTWGPIQRGFGIVLTPKVDGHLTDIEFDGCTVYNVGGGLNVTGRNPTDADPVRTDDIRIRNCKFTIDRNAWGPSAYGFFMLLQDGVGRVLVENCDIAHNGNSFIVVDDRERVASLIVRGCRFNAGQYGLKHPYGNNGDHWEQTFDELVIEGNEITGASSVFRRVFPRNVYV